ncbi:uncharacterized protein MYCFIDRAFT_128036, partial [Pseudocercospora fijiensis CIRAD86]
MLWYLLSPIRGTTQPPRLSANHPIRKAFYRHGKTTATHWLLTMLVSVAIAMGFAYPSIALSDNPTAGIAAIPHTVWTIAKPIDDATAQVDIELRQIWIHGSFMNALDKDVLKRALTIQQSLVGDDSSSNTIPRLDDKLRSGTLQWGYHSPLMYWNNSHHAIDADTDLLETINSRTRTSSSLNVGMRPASVFAGKKFEGKKLISADALVITLMNKASDSIGQHWESRMQDLGHLTCDTCTLFPANGRVTRQRVYEFSFTPLSLPEHTALTLAYSAMALYVIFSFRRMRAFHSRFGLMSAAIFMMTCSILASLTICGILKINLSTIPQNAYPFEWMRMQDFDTAKEVLKLAKPGADKFIMRLFAPLVVVLGGSDRAGVHSTRELWTQALRSFAVHHFYPVAVAIVFAVAFVAVLMNFLLYSEAGDEDNEMTLEDLEDNLTATSINLPHRLDIVKMASNDNGHFVTIGLDRTIAISVYDAISQAHHATGVPQNILKAIEWPIHHIAVDDSGDWIA